MTDLDAVEGTERRRLESSNADSLHLLGDIQSLLCAHLSVQAFLDDLARLATAQPDVRDLVCRVVAKPPGGPVLVGCSDVRATVLDDAEYEFDEGPALEVSVTGEPVHVPDWGSETRWPGYRHLTRHLDVVSSLSLPLAHRRGCCGSITFYSFFGSGPFVGKTRDRLLVFAAHAAMSVMVMLRQIDLAKLTASRQTMAERNDFDVATGIVMAQLSCTVTDAQEILNRRSTTRRWPLRTTVREVLDSVEPKTLGPGAA